MALPILRNDLPLHLGHRGAIDIQPSSSPFSKDFEGVSDICYTSQLGITLTVVNVYLGNTFLQLEANFTNERGRPLTGKKGLSLILY